MKKVLLWCLVLGISSFSFAEYSPPSRELLVELINKKYAIKELDSKCNTLSELGSAFMKSRQSHLSSELLSNLIEADSLPLDMKAKEKQMVLQAFLTPIINDLDDKNRVISHFGLMVFLECREKGLVKDWDLK